MNSAHWKGHIERQRQSHQSVAAYCRQHGLNPQSFYKQRIQMKRMAKSVASASPKEGLIKVDLTQAESSGGMIVEVQIGKGMRLVSSEWPPAEVLKSYREVLG